MTSGLENSGVHMESGGGKWEECWLQEKAKAADLSVCTAGCSWAFLAVSGPCVGHQADKRRGVVAISGVVV